MASSWNPNSNTLKPDWTLHSHSATCVIAQQYSSATFVQWRFHSLNEKYGALSKELLQSFYFLGVFAIWRKASSSFVRSVYLSVFLCPSFSVRPSVCLSLRPSVRMEQLGPHWTDWHEISRLNIFQKSVENIQLSVKCDKNNVHFQCIYGNIMFGSS